MSAAVGVGELTLDDTLLAVVQLSHEHGLPLRGASVHAGSVLVFCDLADVLCWTQWLARSGDLQIVVWRKDDDIAVHVSSTREGIEWALAPSVPAPVDSPVELDAAHRPVSLSLLGELLAGGAA
ncbi:MAG: hypothetical protein ACRDRL_15430 [Sciscionella sp.]